MTTESVSAPVANDDTEVFFSGEKCYSFDVLANDSESTSQKVKIVLPEKISSYNAKISVDRKTNTIKYCRTSDRLCDFVDDTFSYYLEGPDGERSNTATVSVSGSLNQ